MTMNSNVFPLFPDCKILHLLTTPVQEDLVGFEESPVGQHPAGPHGADAEGQAGGARHHRLPRRRLSLHRH